MHLHETFTLKCERAEQGLWYVTSPEFKGLLVAEVTASMAIRATPSAIISLMKAKGVAVVSEPQGDAASD